MNRKVVFGILAALLLAAGIAGAAGVGYRVGVAQGIGQSPQVAEQLQALREGNGRVSGVPVGPMMGRAWGGYGMGQGMQYGYGMHPGWGGPGSILFGVARVLFTLFIIGLLLRLFFGWRRGPWRMGRGGPSWMDEWHKRAHAEPPKAE